MSLNVKSITVNGTEVTLRLTSKALLNFNLKHGAAGQSPVVAVLSALDDMEARIDLFTNALSHPDNKNTVKNGADLLDLMADDPCWARDQANCLILELAYESGLLSGEDFSSLLEPVAQNSKKLISTLADLLAGKPVGTAGAEATTDSEENPT